MNERAKEQLRIALSLRLTQRIKQLMCEYANADGTPPVDNAQYLEALHNVISHYDQETKLLIGGAG